MAYSRRAEGVGVARPGPGPVLGGRRAWLIAVMLIIFMFINYADKAVLGLSAPGLTAELHLSATSYGLLASGFFVLFSVSAVVVGVLSDRWPTKWTLLVMALLWSLMQLPMLGAVGFGTVLVSRIVLGAAEGPALPMANHAAYKWFGNVDRSLVGAVLTLGAPLGSLSAPVLSAVIVHYGWHAAFGVVAVLGFVWALLWLAIGREGPEPGQPSPVAGSVLPLSTPGRGGVSRIPLRCIVTTGTWLAGLAASFAAYWSVSLLVAWLPNYLEKGLGYTVSTAGTLVVLPWIVGAVSILGQGVLTRWLMARGVPSRWARGLLGGAVVFVSGAALLGFVYAPIGWAKLALMAVGFNLAGLIFGISQTAISELSPVSQRGTALGIYTGLYASAGIIAPYLTGRLVDAAARPLEGFNLSFVITSALMMITGLSVAVWMRPEHDRARLATSLAVPTASPPSSRSSPWRR